MQKMNLFEQPLEAEKEQQDMARISEYRQRIVELIAFLKDIPELEGLAYKGTFALGIHTGDSRSTTTLEIAVPNEKVYQELMRSLESYGDTLRLQGKVVSCQAVSVGAGALYTCEDGSVYLQIDISIQLLPHCVTTLYTSDCGEITITYLEQIFAEKLIKACNRTGQEQVEEMYDLWSAVFNGIMDTATIIKFLKLLEAYPLSWEKSPYYEESTAVIEEAYAKFEPYDAHLGAPMFKPSFSKLREDTVAFVASLFTRA